MNDLPDIINSQIISNKYDVFWTNTSEDISQLSPKSVLIVTTPFAPESEEATLLKKIILASKLDENEVNVIQFQNEIAWHQLKDQLGVKTIILFGITPDQLGVSVQLMPHQVSRFSNTNWIVTASLKQLEDKLIKDHLWNYGLKPVFIEKAYG